MSSNQTRRPAMKRVIVTRAAGQASSLASRLEAAGFTPLVIPVIGPAAPLDDGAALRAAVESLNDRYDWVAITSPNGAAAFASVVEPGKVTALVAAVGPGTADALVGLGCMVSLVPNRSIAEGLVEALATVEPARILLPQAADARPVLADSLLALGWQVTVVQSYRTVHLVPPAPLVAEAVAADAIVFTSSSTVDAWVEAIGVSATPRVVVSIGPATSATVAGHGMTVASEADPHTLDGLIEAVKSALRR